MFVVKLNADGAELLYATFLGGENRDVGEALAVDEAGHVYLTGQTWSPDFPTTPGAFDRTCGSDGTCDEDPGPYSDGFAAKLNADGAGLVYATFLGGSSGESGRAIALDEAGCAYLTGFTWPPDFLGGADDDANAFVVKLNAGGTGLSAATLLGGSSPDFGEAIAVDEAGSVYVTGDTWSADFPTTPGAFDRSLGGDDDAFVARLNADSLGPIYATFLGGNDEDWGMAVAGDGMANAYVAGNTLSADFPTTQGAFDRSLSGLQDVFVAKLDSSGAALTYATFLGGGYSDLGTALAVDGLGRACVTGLTPSADFPTTPGAYDAGYGGGGDAFVAQVGADGTGLDYATFLGGSSFDQGNSLAVIANEAGNIYVAGSTSSANFPTTPGAFDPGYNGDGDAFVTQIVLANLITVTVSAPTLARNDDGWYRDNPLLITATVHNATDAAWLDPSITLRLGSEDDAARFFVLDENGHQSTEDQSADPDAPDFSDTTYAETFAVPGPLAAGESYSTTWWVWVQPSVAATLKAEADLVTTIPQLLRAEDDEEVAIDQAQIHPVVFLHGILGSMPPGQKLWTDHPTPGQIVWPEEPVLDPFLLSYYPMLHHLEVMGCEWGKTLFALTYDWRDSNDVSAEFLRNQLAGTVIPQAATLPYVASDGKADLVVHSMGGLVSRAYIQGDDYDGDVNKVIFVASPHKGFASDYRTREGLTWSDYFGNEVPWQAGWIFIGPLMDGILWPYLIEDQYNPTLGEIEKDCIWIPPPPGFLWPPGHWDCSPAYYMWSHDDERGIPSLYQMLPTQDMGDYLFGESGQPWPCTAGVKPEAVINEWLEDLDANISALGAALGVDNIYVLYSEAFPLLTDHSYEAGCGQNPWRWLYGGPTQDRMHTYGDDLIPVHSTTLLQSGLLSLPEDNEQFILGYGHKGIMYAPQAQEEATEFLTGVPLTGTAEYEIPPVWDNIVRIIAIIVGSPVEIMVTDPAGQRLGYDPATGEKVIEIPDAFYTGQGDVQFMLLYNTLPGQYQIAATGVDAGEYELETYVVEEGGARLLDILTGTVTARQVVTHTVAYTVAGTTLFFDDMESGGGNWVAEGGWSLVTDTAHSPITAWDSGVVTPGVPLTLTLLAPLDLSAARMASLTFWHTYTLSPEAQAQVDLSTDNGATWQTLAIQQSGAHGWTPATMNLTRFTGPGYESLRLRFRLRPGGPGDRWRIDDVQVEAQEPPALFELPFEDDVEGWRKWEGTGDWSVATGTVHGGQHSWGATQDGSALTSVGRLNLPESTAPWFSFWHLFDESGGAGVVEISPDGTAWQTLTTVGTTEGNWQRIEADLSGYAGQSVYLRFRLDAPGGGGWWLDDLAAWETIPPVVHSLPFDDDMEDPEANWRAVNAWEPVTATAHSGMTAWQGSDDDSALILVDQLDLTKAVSPTLTFWQRFVLPEGSVGQMRVTIDDEVTWQPILTITEPISDWGRVEVNLSAYAGHRVGLAFILDEVADEGTGSAGLQPAMHMERPSTAQPPLAMPGVATALPLVMIALVAVVKTDDKRYWHWKKVVIVGSVILAAGWVCLFPCGLWYHVPPLRFWIINRLDVVEGGKVDLIVSASRKPGDGYLSPDGRWMLVHSRTEHWLLLDLIEGSEQLIGAGSGPVRWLEDDLFIGEGFKDYFLRTVPEGKTTRVPEYPKEKMDGVQEVELVRRADRVYAVENLGFSGYLFVALDKEFRYAIVPRELTTEEEKALLQELSQAVVVPKEPHATMVMVERMPHARYYSPDGTLYAQGEPIVGANRTPYLEVRITEGDELIARVRKRGYAPVPLGWSADGRSFYFQMQTGAVAGVLAPEWPVYRLRLPDTVPVSTPTLAGESRAPGVAPLVPVAYRPAFLAQAGSEAGWYIDDVRVLDVAMLPYIFIDDFDRPDDTDLGPDWIEIEGDWEIRDEQLHIQTEDDQAAIVATSHTFTETHFAIETQIRGEADDPYVFFFGADPKAGTGYGVRYEPADSQLLLVREEVEADLAPLDTVSIHLDPKVWYGLRVVRDGETGLIQVYLDEGAGYGMEPILEAGDTTYPALEQVGWRVYSAKSDFYVDWIVVR